MADIFNSQPGYVSIVSIPPKPGGGVLPGRISLQGADGKEASFKAALIGGVDYDQSTNQQFMETLDGSIFIYVFGDHMGSVKVKGIAFPAECTGAEEGIAEVLQFYQDNRASQQPIPVTVLLGKRIVVKGFLTHVTVSTIGVATDPAAMMNEYTMTINALPGG